MWQQYRCVCTYARSKPKPLFSTVRGVRVTEFSRTDQRCPFKSSGRTPPVCLCVCVFHYNDPKHSVYAATRALLLRSWIYNFPCGRKRHKICLELFLKVTVVLQNSLQCISTHKSQRMIRPLSARNEELDKVETTRSRAWSCQRRWQKQYLWGVSCHCDCGKWGLHRSLAVWEGCGAYFG